jgi:hypothetical protein
MSIQDEHLTPDQWSELKKILLKEERERIDKLEDNWTFPDGFSEQVANVLPLAVDKAEKKNEDLTETLFPVVEKSIYRSVKTNIQPMADALFPVMGPAIRKAIQDAMRKTVESLNQTLESSFTVKGIKWRIQAKASGKSYAEIVLRNTLKFRVEQVFLIHRNSGLLIAHESFSAAHEDNTDLISSMLTAIQDFVNDSFNRGEGQALESIQVGSGSVWLEQSPNVILAAVVEGDPPQSLRDVMKETLEEVHHRFGRMLNDFDGDTTPYKPAHRIIAQCLISEAREDTKKKGLSPALLVAILLLLAIGGFSTFRGIQQHRWNHIIKGTKAQPGLVVLNDERHGRILQAVVLKDRKAINPTEKFVTTARWKADKVVNYAPGAFRDSIRIYHKRWLPLFSRNRDYIPDGAVDLSQAQLTRWGERRIQRLTSKAAEKKGSDLSPEEQFPIQLGVVMRLKHTPVMVFEYRPYVSDDPAFAIEKLLERFPPNDSVIRTENAWILYFSGKTDLERGTATISLDKHFTRFTGIAPLDWRDSILNSGLLESLYLPFDLSGLGAIEEKLIPPLQEELKTVRFQFAFASTTLNPDDLPRVERMGIQIASLDKLGRKFNRTWTLKITGTADAVGSVEQRKMYATNRAKLFFEKYLPKVTNVIYLENSWDPNNILPPELERTVSFELFENKLP